MYDYAIDKYVPVRFFDYVTQTWSTERPSVPGSPRRLPAPASGLTYLQIAREGLGLQKTQNGGGVTPPAAPQNSAYHRYGSRVKARSTARRIRSSTASTPASTGIADSRARRQPIPEGRTHGHLASRRRRRAPVFHREAHRDRAHSGRRSESHAHSYRTGEFQRAGRTGQERCALRTRRQRRSVPESPGHFTRSLSRDYRRRRSSGAGAADAAPGRARATLRCSAADRDAADPPLPSPFPGQSFAVETRIYNETPEALKVESIEVVPSDGKNWNIRPEGDEPHEVAPGKEEQWRFSVTVPADAAFTRPYFSRPNEEQPYYDVNDPRYRNSPTRALSSGREGAPFL